MFNLPIITISLSHCQDKERGFGVESRVNWQSLEEFARKGRYQLEISQQHRRGKENPTFDTFIKLASALNIELASLFDFSHKGKSAKELKGFITDMAKSGNEEKLELAARLLKAIYL